jgi:multiple antibiotic resistance protein
VHGTGSKAVSPEQPYHRRPHDSQARHLRRKADAVFANFWTDVATLMATIDPFSVVPVYLGLTHALTADARSRVLLRAIFIAFAILFAFLIVGELALNAMGISVDAFRIAGGIVLLLVGVKMVFAQGTQTTPGEASNPDRDIAVFPLGMPYVAGPASIMSIVLLTENDLHSIPQQACTLISLCIVLSVTYLVLRAASPLQKLLGGTGINVLGRIMGLVLASLAVQALITGLRNVFFTAQ